ncbi:MAG: hypothetical protein KF779_02930 [Hyphomonadaceae bacterium]|nr:hypothetical protein [Hyphomonadaceae bacterium]
MNAAAVAERVARESYGRLLAMLAGRTRDVAAAEDALAEAFAAALSAWPRGAVPDNPEAWLFAAAKRKLIDVARRRHTAQAGERQIVLGIEELEAEIAARDLPDRRKLKVCCARRARPSGLGVISLKRRSNRRTQRALGRAKRTGTRSCYSMPRFRS